MAKTWISVRVSIRFWLAWHCPFLRWLVNPEAREIIRAGKRANCVVQKALRQNGKKLLPDGRIVDIKEKDHE